MLWKRASRRDDIAPVRRTFSASYITALKFEYFERSYSFQIADQDNIIFKMERGIALFYYLSIFDRKVAVFFF